MVDQEVEEILRQIRDGVRAEEQKSINARSELMSANTDLPPASQPPQTFPNISTMARAWDRLPPVVSNRQGALASLELWLKRILKRSSRWFTWEQINFNAAVHHTVREMVGTLTIYEQQIASLKMQLDDANARLFQLQEQQTSIQSELEPQKTEIRALTRSITELTKVAAELRERAALKTQLRELETRWDLLAKETDVHVQERKELQARINESLLEFKDLNESTLDEQRVSFKQVALQINETAANDERERRALAERIAQLEGGRELSSKASSSSDL